MWGDLRQKILFLGEGIFALSAIKGYQQYFVFLISPQALTKAEKQVSEIRVVKIMVLKK